MTDTSRGVLLINGDDVHTLLEPEALVDAVSDALRAYSDGTAQAPPRIGVDGAEGSLVAMVGGVSGLGLAVKTYSHFGANTERGLPTHEALVVLFDEHTGAPLAVVDGASITLVRTAAVSAAATRVLAGSEVRALTVLGSGPQADAHLDYLSRTCRPAEVRVWARDPARAGALARRWGATAVADADDAVSGSDVVCCCTSADEPLFRAVSVSPGAHVISIGTGTELPQALLDVAEVFVEWAGAAEAPRPAGVTDLVGRPVTELGDVLAGRAPGRTDPDQITVWRSTGLAVADVAAVALVHETARRRGRGVEHRFRAAARPIAWNGPRS
jgi:ornithine cyclodeaminase/alanine dehydrogenase-like protein (mu-crystallin family)